MARRIPARLSSAEGRRFALTVGAAFSVLGSLAWWRGRPTVAMVLVGVGASLIVAGLVVPGKLGPVYRAWMSFAEAISKVTTPIFLGIVYYFPITVTGLVMRLIGRNPMRRRDIEGSYWVTTDQSSDLHRQF